MREAHVPERRAMSSANVKVRISFDFDLQVPPALLALEHDALLKALHAALGSTVVQGMPRYPPSSSARARSPWCVTTTTWTLQSSACRPSRADCWSRPRPT
jgi:hypothetical protein